MNTSQPRIGIIAGSGLGNALLKSGGGGTSQQSIDADTPFGKPSAPITLTDWNGPGGGIPIAFLPRHGLAHTLPPSSVPYRANIYALKAAGCKWIIASGAVGSLREKIAPRDLIIADQVIDKTTRRVGTFFDETGGAGAAVHVELAEPFCPKLREILLATARNLPTLKVHPTGTYICMEGPAFSTRAESLMHQQWGGDLIGMTAMPEAKLAREAEISYALIALATDYDCWRPHVAQPPSPASSTFNVTQPPSAVPSKQALLAEIIGHMHAATANALALIQSAVPELWSRREEPFDAHRALELAIWTDKSQIPPPTKQRLALLWSKYL